MMIDEVDPYRQVDLSVFPPPKDDQNCILRISILLVGEHCLLFIIGIYGYSKVTYNHTEVGVLELYFSFYVW